MSHVTLNHSALPFSGDRYAVPFGRRSLAAARAGIDATRAWLAEAWRRSTSRHLLGELDAHALKDIGVSAADAEYEANKPFWRR